MANQREVDLVEAQSQSLRAFTSFLESRGWSIDDTMEVNLVASLKHTMFPIIQDPFQVVPSRSRPWFV